MIGAMARLALSAIHHRIAKTRHMPGRFPDLRVHDDCGVKPNHIVPRLNNPPPPPIPQIILQFHSQRPVIPRISKPSVDLAPGKHKTPTLCQGYDFVHQRRYISHTDADFSFSIIFFNCGKSSCMVSHTTSTTIPKYACTILFLIPTMSPHG